VTFRVVFLGSAEQDLRELKQYLVKNFGAKVWQTSYRDIKNSIGTLKSFPLAGSVPDEIRSLHLLRYRQVVTGRNRIIYEIREDTIYIHIICDTRKDMRSLLASRLLRAPR
jgi:plasmid stabilization system protein ParE